MKVNRGELPEGQDVYLRAQKIQKQDTRGREAGVGGVGREYEVNLSSRSRALREIRDGIDRLPEVRVDRIERIRESIANGTYTIDPVKIAEKMLEEI